MKWILLDGNNSFRISPSLFSSIPLHNLTTGTVAVHTPHSHGSGALLRWGDGLILWSAGCWFEPHNNPPAAAASSHRISWEVICHYHVSFQVSQRSTCSSTYLDYVHIAWILILFSLLNRLFVCTQSQRETWTYMNIKVRSSWISMESQLKNGDW